MLSNQTYVNPGLLKAISSLDLQDWDALDMLTAFQGDIVFGGSGDDTLDASSGIGDNRLFGQVGNDTLFAGANDTLIGGDGNDRLFALMSGNTLTGGSGLDQFVLVASEGPANTITDFELGTDVIRLGGLNGVAEFKDLDVTQSGADALIKAGGLLD